MREHTSEKTPNLEKALDCLKEDMNTRIMPEPEPSLSSRYHATDAPNSQGSIVYESYRTTTRTTMWGATAAVVCMVFAVAGCVVVAAIVSILA